MHEQLSERAKGHFYMFSILLAALLVRVVVGLHKPVLSFEQTVITGLTAVVFLSPFLYRTFHGEELLSTMRKKVCHSVAMVLSGGLFFYYIALSA
ncbi:MAG: hypothetical protein JWM80_5244 [Cyanobacteria bacterium RYN_339]|nr:hypothetical protein [Cyanobacteria bacterium RYN_339]